MILVCGATGDLGGRIVRILIGSGQQVRALVRPATDAAHLQGDGVEVVRGDLREPATLGPALAGIDTVITTANAISRMMTGRTDLTIAAVDGAGNQNLIRAAERSGVNRFVFVSAAGMGEDMARLAPLMAAKWAAETALRATSMQVVIVRPEMYQESWLTSGIDLAAGRALIFGRGELAHRYVAMDDVAALCAHLALTPDPPVTVEFGGPEAVSPLQVVAALEAATGRRLKVRHVPRAAMSVGYRVLKRIKPAMASGMGLALFCDTHTGTWDDAPLRAAGIDPRPASEFIASAAGART